MKRIDRDTLRRMNDVEHADFILVNVLPCENFNKQHTRTSISIPVANDDLAGHVEVVASGKKRTIVVDCASFECDASPTYHFSCLKKVAQGAGVTAHLLVACGAHGTERQGAAALPRPRCACRGSRDDSRADRAGGHGTGSGPRSQRDRPTTV
ncbi:hypothetical protein [Thioalkalivibrio nitratireducens]|uniref:hypothetical protein n=1 Tax=Thioalkalivibrio nitratireducens TaxID=186931 RepID=UPI001F2BD868|nr:hypothetical protein [Thioalkalivibrio nitratireducens]